MKHYVATNQVTGAGAITSNGNLELIRRSFEAESFDFDEPHIFCYDESSTSLCKCSLNTQPDRW